MRECGRIPYSCSHLTNKLTVDFKSFCLFLLVSMTDSYSKKELDHESSLHCCVTMKLVYNQVFFPFSFVFFFPYATTCLPACLPALVFCFRFSVLFRYLPISISCNTTLHIYQHLRTCLSVAQTGYPLLGLIRHSWMVMMRMQDFLVQVFVVRDIK